MFGGKVLDVGSAVASCVYLYFSALELRIITAFIGRKHFASRGGRGETKMIRTQRYKNFRIFP
jgi:hypothetical protein